MARTPSYVGVALLAMSTLVLEVLLARITSVVAWYHLSFFVIALSMLGLTAGAVVVSCAPRRFADAVLPARLRQLSLAFAVLAPLALALALGVRLGPIHDFDGFTATLLYGTLLAVPFACAGAALTLALTRAGLPPGLVYGVDLIGAACGCALVIALLDVVDAPSAVLVAAALGALAALAFARADSTAPRSSSALALVVTLVLVGLAASNANSGGGLLRPHWVKGERDAVGQQLFTGWNTYSRVTVDRTESEPPAFWAASPNIPSELLHSVPQRAIRIDGAAGTAMTGLDVDPDDGRPGSALDHAYGGWDVTAFAHVLRPAGPAFVIGVGGGRDVVEAVRVGHAPVVGIELNGLIVALHRGPMREFSGVVDLPGVELVGGEARSFLTADPRRYSVITMSLIDTWAATGAGAYALSENGLYTVESWRVFLSHLDESGVFTVSRWFVRHAPHETARMLALARETLWSLGIAEPERQLVLLQNLRIATLLVANRPWTPDELATLEREAARRGFAVLVAPGQLPDDPLLHTVATLPDREALARWTDAQELDLSPSSDDRPFFFNMLRPRAWLGDAEELDRLGGAVQGNLLATQTLVYTTLCSLLLAVLAIAIPLSARRRDLVAWPSAELFAAAAYFALIGFGFMFVEMALLSRLSMLLGHPTLALAVLLGGVILFAGLGSLASSRIDVGDRRLALGYPLLPVVAIGLVALLLDATTLGSAGASLGTRIAIGIAMVAVPAAAMGIGFPLGLRLASRAAARDPARAELGPWLWGINGACGVVASGVGLTISMAFGITSTLLLGALCYLALVACTRRLYDGIASSG